jgi:hypothetical protein
VGSSTRRQRITVERVNPGSTEPLTEGLSMSVPKLHLPGGDSVMYGDDEELGMDQVFCA